MSGVASSLMGRGLGTIFDLLAKYALYSAGRWGSCPLEWLGRLQQVGRVALSLWTTGPLVSSCPIGHSLYLGKTLVWKTQARYVETVVCGVQCQGS